MGKAVFTAALVLALAFPAPRAEALENEDLLALVAMPLAVAAVSEVTDVPMNELIDVVTLMNDAAVPPAQFVEVVRYAPVALVVEDDEPDFVQFVRTRFDDGLRGTQLVTVIEDRLRTFDLPAIDLDVPETRIVRVIDEDDDFVPVVVRNRIAEARRHPHGGPPGQLKKEAGVQTGAEIVHGTTRTARVRVDDDDRGRGRDREVTRERKEPSGRGHGHGGGHGKGKGKGKG